MRRRAHVDEAPPGQPPALHAGDAAGLPGARLRPPWRIVAGPYEVEGAGDSEEWLRVVARDGCARSVAVDADEAALWARRTGTGPRSTREAVASRGFTLVFDAIADGAAPPGRIVIG